MTDMLADTSATPPAGRRNRLTNPDVIVGLIGVILAWGALYLIKDLPMRQGFRVGPAYTPTVVGYAILGLSGLIMIKGIIAGSTSPAIIVLRPLLGVTAAIVAFGLLIPYGFIIASVATIAIAALASPISRLFDTLILIVVLTTASALIFIVGLGLPMSLWF